MTSEKIKEIRLLMGFTQNEMGKKIGMSQQAYSKIETDRKPTKIHIAAVLLLIIAFLYSPVSLPDGYSNKRFSNQGLLMEIYYTFSDSHTGG